MDLVGLLSFVVAVLLVPTSGLLAVTDTVLSQFTKARAAALAEEGRQAAAELAALLEQREDTLHAVLLLEQMCEVAAAALIAVAAYRAAGFLALAVTFLLALPLMFIVGVALPRTWAMHNLDRAAALAAPIGRLVSRPWPLRFLVSGSLRMARRLFGRADRHEILALGDESFIAVAGSPIEADELAGAANPLLAAIITFGETVVREIMVPRTDMVTIPGRMRVAEAVDVVRREGYSRFPMTGDGVDDVTGTVFAKDLVNAALEGRTELAVEELAHPARFVPETKAAAVLLREMQQEKLHQALVVDEYGGIAGLVTMEDIIEELVGDISDEYDEEVPAIEQLPDGRTRVDGALSIDEANDRFGLHFPDGDWDTLGGLVFDYFGHVPAVGDVAHIAGARLEVEDLVGRRIRSLLLEVEA